MRKNILVTGCADANGQAIINIIRDAFPKFFIVGTDVYANHVGKFMCNQFEIVPFASHDNYISVIQNLIDKYDINILVPTSEIEICFFNKRRTFLNHLDVSVLIINEFAVDVGLDKLKTMETLGEKNILVPWTLNAQIDDPKEYPCIFKNRSTSGSKSVELIHNAKEAQRCCLREKSVWQEVLLPANQEYTCCIYRSKSGEIRILVMLRELENGETKYAKIVQSNEINCYLKSIALALDLKGSMNIQLVLTKNGPLLFEINPRFSSTVGFRHLVGFRDFEWQLLELMKIDLVPFSDMELINIEYFRKTTCLVRKKNGQIKSFKSHYI
ncbi:MAG: ATP-grasp domain-containing protein [bacterium]